MTSLYNIKLLHNNKEIRSSKIIGDLADSRELFTYQLVHIAVKHNVDVTLEADPDVIEFVR